MVASWRSSAPRRGYVRGEQRVCFWSWTQLAMCWCPANMQTGNERDCGKCTSTTTRKRGLFGGQERRLWRHVYGDGQRQFEGTFSFGQPTGKHRSWHPNGILEEEGKYERGPNTRNGDSTMTQVWCCTSTFTGTASCVRWTVRKWTNDAMAS